MTPAIPRLGALLLAVPLFARALTPGDAEGRLSVARQLARERNDRALVAEVEQTWTEIRKALGQRCPAEAETRLRALEARVGVDPGGWSMAGQPLFHPTREMADRLRAFGPELDAAMRIGDPARVRAVTAAMIAVLGDQAGVPDARRAGRKPEPRTLTAAEATRLFLDALDTQDRHLRQLQNGKPLPDQMLRFYGYLLNAVTAMLPFAESHQPDRRSGLDELASGLASLLTGLQQPAGFFPFPDLRGRNIRFGDMTERQLREGKAEIRDGWIVSIDPGGGSQFDTGVCGSALLHAGKLRDRPDWVRAGVLAADWALDQPCCANFNYNAFSVSLLAHAYRTTGEGRYLDGALQKFRVGVAPGQAPSGRWLDPHNARTVYHLIILRALGDLATALPVVRAAERAELDAVIRPALAALLDEFDAMGLTVEALPELLTLAALYPADQRLRAAVAAMACGIVAKCTDGKRVRMGVQPDQLAAVARWAAGR